MKEVMVGMDYEWGIGLISRVPMALGGGGHVFKDHKAIATC